MEEKAELESKSPENGRGRKEKLGGVRTMPFILGNEACDRFAYAGYHANLITYLTQILNLPLVKASNTVSNFTGTASFTPLIGAFIADSSAGRFRTILAGSTIYVLGMVTLTISAVLPQFRPPPCPTRLNCQEASNSQLWILYTALILISLGIGGIRPCLVTFAADQFDMSKSKVEKRGWNFFNWYFFCMELAALLALTVLVYIEDNVSWAWGLGIPTITLALSAVLFLTGSPLYNKIKPSGSPYVRVVQVVVAAMRKRRAVLPEDSHALYENRSLDAEISVNGRLLHSNQFKFLDRAAVVVVETDIDESNQPNLWRLATVHRVEELKTILRLMPIWAATVIHVASHSHVHSFTVEQARTMDRHLSPSFQIPPASMLIFTTITVIILLPLYERLFVPFARCFTKNPAGITCLQRMGIGFGINIFATVVAAMVEMRRKHTAMNHGLVNKPASVIPISVFWLVPQFFLNGVMQVFMTVGHLEFLYDQAPESMRSTAAALYWISIGVGNYAGTLIVSLVHKYSSSNRGAGGGVEWLPDRNLNKGKLDEFYWLMSGIQVLNLMYYVACTRFYKYKSVKECCDDDFESGGDTKVVRQSENS